MAVARDKSPILDLDEIEVTLVGDSVISEVHREFMSIDEPTDVITFDHGEILISTETATTQAAENQNSPEKETATYIIHGLLHLAGYADKAPEEFAEMAALQQGILDKIWSPA
jgi:probable rRNA maturation factor